MDFVCDFQTANSIKKIVQYSREDKDGDKLLKAYDRALGVKWLWDKERWAIYTKNRKGKEYFLYIVETLAGGYRWVSSIDRQYIAKMDNARLDKAESALRRIEQHEVDMDETRRKTLTNEVTAISKERWRSVMQNPLIPVGVQL